MYQNVFIHWICASGQIRRLEIRQLPSKADLHNDECENSWFISSWMFSVVKKLSRLNKEICLPKDGAFVDLTATVFHYEIIFKIVFKELVFFDRKSFERHFLDLIIICNRVITSSSVLLLSIFNSGRRPDAGSTVAILAFWVLVLSQFGRLAC